MSPMKWTTNWGVLGCAPSGGKGGEGRGGGRKNLCGYSALIWIKVRVHKSGSLRCVSCLLLLR
jgi:hypothetical protein